MIITKTVVTVSCDDCGPDYWHNQGEGIPIWATTTDARHDLTGSGWQFTDHPGDQAGDQGGDQAGGESGEVVCPDCCAARICADVGHTFLPLTRCRCEDRREGRFPGHAEQGCPAWVSCAMCGLVEPASAPGADL